MKWSQMNRSKINVVSNVVVSNERGLNSNGTAHICINPKDKKCLNAVYSKKYYVLLHTY